METICEGICMCCMHTFLPCFYVLYLLFYISDRVKGNERVHPTMWQLRKSVFPVQLYTTVDVCTSLYQPYSGSTWNPDYTYN
jgi:hypothetical protein